MQEEADVLLRLSPPHQFRQSCDRSSSHLLGLLGFLLGVPAVPAVHASRRSEEAAYERGGGRLRGRHSPGRGVVVVPDHLAVGGRGSVRAGALLVLPGQSLLQHADA